MTPCRICRTPSAAAFCDHCLAQPDASRAHLETLRRSLLQRTEDALRMVDTAVAQASEDVQARWHTLYAARAAASDGLAKRVAATRARGDDLARLLEIEERAAATAWRLGDEYARLGEVLRAFTQTVVAQRVAAATTHQVQQRIVEVA